MDRADAYQQLNDGTPGGLAMRCKTFVDALVWMVIRFQTPPELGIAVHYTRPALGTTSTSKGKRPAKRPRSPLPARTLGLRSAEEEGICICIPLSSKMLMHHNRRPPDQRQGYQRHGYTLGEDE